VAVAAAAVAITLFVIEGQRGEQHAKRRVELVSRPGWLGLRGEL
jgi:hypothetical protein